jgi:hypothetical protein
LSATKQRPAIDLRFAQAGGADMVHTLMSR